MAKPKIYQQLSINCVSSAYPIYIGDNLLSDHDLLRRHVLGKQVMIVTNDKVAPLYLQNLKQAFADIQCDVIILGDGEINKNQQNLTNIYDALIQGDHHRDTTLIALGGGVIGDITGFAAATYQRGVAFIQLPTTLLAQVDASVGGKTAINHPEGKNMIGSFHQPKAVIMDISTLSTLPEREFRSGFAEIIKYGLLVGGDLLSKINIQLDEGISVNSIDKLSPLIAASCNIKALFVEEDERETGNRALLNLGHTFAHSLEAYTHYETWLHGEAVAIGIYCAALLSYKLGNLEKSELIFIDSLLKKAKLPSRIPKDIDLAILQELMMHDKKVKDKTLHFVLLKNFGDCYIDNKVTTEILSSVLKSAIEGY